ncbi:MAG TPA: isochorismatase family cysteine hydrolase [Thermomicrobiales bacterium]|nr:isochorismatase family cysteine hydrolase [Thermomicrobiales bacterium]
MKAILVVDVQQGFINDFTKAIPGRIARLLAREAYETIAFTRFINVPNGPYPRFLDWHACAGPPETDLAPELAAWVAEGQVFDKRGFTGIPADLAAHIARLGLTEMDVVGLDTDMCVLKCAMDLFDRAVKPIVLADCCASTAGLQAHLAGLAVLARNIGALQLREAGLADGYLGAPPDGGGRG